MLDELRGLLNHLGSKAEAQRQREAMIDLLIWTMYADKVLALPENDHIDQLTADMEWDSPTSASQYLNVSIARIRDVLGNGEKAEALVESIKERLATEEMRRDAYAACRELTKIDGEVADEEMEFLRMIKQRFEITDAP